MHKIFLKVKKQVFFRLCKNISCGYIDAGAYNFIQDKL